MSDTEDDTITKTEKGEVLGKNTDDVEGGKVEKFEEERSTQETDDVASKSMEEVEVLNVADTTEGTIEKTEEEEAANETTKKSEKEEDLEKNRDNVEGGKAKNFEEKQFTQETDDVASKNMEEVEVLNVADSAKGIIQKTEEKEAVSETTKKSKKEAGLERIVDSAKEETLKQTEVLGIITEDTENSTTRETEDQVVFGRNSDVSTSPSTAEEADNVEYITTKETEYINIINKSLPLSFTQKRHADTIEGLNDLFGIWRLEDEVRTVCIALVLCLKFDIVPRDIVKTKPCAKLECWGDPFVVSPKQAIIQIGSRLEKQYDRLQFKSIKFGEEVVYKKARCHQLLDPNVDEIKEMCLSLRKRSKGERVLFHYNGHGVLKPSQMGEIFVFNKTHSKYMPVSVWDLINWISPPIIFVFDCSRAEVLIDTFEMYLKRQQYLFEDDLRKCIIHMGASSYGEVLPMHPDLPADIFTSCLTTPVKMAMHWHVVVRRCRLIHNVDLNLILRMPGKLNDRRTMLGELYWIFTAVTDTIAWSTFTRDLFHTLYRQDEILASLFRNYLLAERILEAQDCTPLTYPKLPCTFKHHLWNTWDYVLDQCLSQLPDVVNSKKSYKHSTFFTEQLIAFERWLWFGSEEKDPPEQLPIVLQVLLNKTYRMQALDLLVRFLDLGPWAVNLALSVGIFPYMLQLLNKKTVEFQKPLVFIWAKILAVDNSCQVDLILDNDCKCFISILKDHSFDPIYRTLAAFVLASVVNNFAAGQYTALGNSLITMCLEELSDGNAKLKQWVAICLARVWDKYTTARWTGVRDNAHVKLYPLLQDPCPEVRAAAVYALGTFIHSVNNLSEHADKINQAIAITLVDKTCHDMSPLVRQELVAALQWITLTYRYKFISLAAQESGVNTCQTTPPMNPLKRCGSSFLPTTGQNLNIDFGDSPHHLRRTSSISSISSLGSPISPQLRYSPFNVKTWAALCCLEVDAHPKVAQMSAVVTNYIRSQVNKSIDFRRRANTGASSSSSNVDKSEFEGIHKPLVTTQFVPWACKLIAQPLLKTDKPENDPESELHYERDWRLQRNTNVHKKSQEEYEYAWNHTMYSQVYSRICAEPPTVLKFHPYDQQIAIAGEHNFVIWNWGQKHQLGRLSKTTLSISNNIKKVTALEWINAHDVALLMSAFDDGSVELWRPAISGDKSVLVSAWKVYNELTPPSKLIPSDVLLTWEQWTQTVIASGSARVIRLWDVEQELHAYDIPTGAKHPVTCLDSRFADMDYKNMVLKSKEDNFEQFANQKHGLITTGFADGSIRLYDRRCRPRDAQVITLMDHISSILAVQLRGDNIISGCINGYVRIYDIRSKTAVNTYYEPQMENFSAIAIHRNADIYAWGSRDRYISLYNMFGDNLNVLRFQEGSLFNSRIGSVSCLAFHPHKVILAAGTTDSAVIFYSMANQQEN